jgi:hypothetical protein
MGFGVRVASKLTSKKEKVQSAIYCSIMYDCDLKLFGGGIVKKKCVAL